MTSRGGVRGQANVFGVDAVKEMGHGGVAGHGEMGDFLNGKAMPFEQSMNDFVDGGHHCLLESSKASLLLSINNAGDDIISIAQLAVIVRRLPDNFTFGQIQELHPDCGGADIHGQSEMTISGVPRFNIHKTGIAGLPLGEIQGGRHLEVLLANNLGQFASQQEIQGQVFQSELAVQALFQARQVTDIVTQGGGGELQKFFLEGRVV